MKPGEAMVHYQRAAELQLQVTCYNLLQMSHTFSYCVTDNIHEPGAYSSCPMGVHSNAIPEGNNNVGIR